MNVQEIAKQLLRMIGVTSLDPTANANNLNRRGLEDGDLDFAAICITGALQEIFERGPTALGEQRYSEALRPPTGITLTVTQYSKTISVTGYQSWMEGCTIVVSGDSLHNELLSSTQLLRPYMGSSGSVGGTVYADAIPLPSTLKNVIEPIEIPGVFPLRLVNSREQFRYYQGEHLTTSGPYTQQVTHYSLFNRDIGEPCVAFVDAQYDANSDFTPIYLRVNPMPGSAYPITFRVKVKPPVITAADIGDHDTDPDIGIPLDWTQSILLPFAMQRMTAHPVCSLEPAQLSEIGRQYSVALGLLEGFAPQISSIQPVYRHH